jgi:hypothetical protein
MELRPPAADSWFMPGTTAVMQIEWPTSDLATRTLTSTLGETMLDVSETVVDDDTILVTITADASVTDNYEDGDKVTWKLIDEGEPIVVGRWTASTRGAEAVQSRYSISIGPARTRLVIVAGPTVPGPPGDPGAPGEDGADAIDTLSTITANGPADLDIATANVWQVTMEADSEFTLLAEAVNRPQAITVALAQDGVGGWAATFVGVAWSGGVLPTLSTGADEVDVLTFLTLDDGASWMGFPAGLMMEVP